MSEIILYTTHCPKCEVLYEKLKSKHINFSVNDNPKDMIAMGYYTAPLLQVDGNILTFSDANKWINDQEVK